MKAASSHGNSGHGHRARSRTSRHVSTVVRPTTAPGKQQQVPKLPDSADTSSSRLISNSFSRRPKTTVGFYDEVASLYTRPQSALGAIENGQNGANTPRPSPSKKSKGYGTKSTKSKRKSRKSTTLVAWEDESKMENHKTFEQSIKKQLEQEKYMYDESGNKLYSHAQSWVMKQRKKTAMKGMSLIPGSVSTMVALQESDEEGRLTEDYEVDITGPPSFADFITSDGSSDFDTDLEEDFPVQPREFDPSGKTLYMKMCKDKKLVPVSFLKDRFMEKEIIMRHHGLGSEGTFPIAKSLVKNTFIEKLDLTDNYIEGPGGIAIATMLLDNCFITEIDHVTQKEETDMKARKFKHVIKKKHYIVLDLSMNFLRSEGGMAFAQMLHKNQSLRKLVLRSNHLTDKDAKAFADALKENRTLTHLDISHNEIGEMGGIYLGAGVASNYGLKHLDISWNCIRFKGAVGIAQSLKSNDCLTHFNMSWNGLSLLGCVALGRFLKKNESLVELDISNNRIGLLATQKLAAGIAAHPNMRVLKIGKNPIGDGGVECLLNVVRSHSTIKFLSLEDITVSPKIFDEIQELEREHNVTIITGGIGGYKRPKEMPPGMRILLSFVQDNRLRLIDWFNQFDKDHSGGISREEFSKGLKETGLVMTKRQLDRLIEFIDINDDGQIEYSELLRGREITIMELRQEKKIEERNKRVETDQMRLPKLEGYDYDLM